MSILRTETSSPTNAGKHRTDSAKPSSVSFGEVYVEGGNDDLTCDGGEQSPLLSPDPKGHKDNIIVQITSETGEDAHIENSKDSGHERTSAKSKHDKVAFCDTPNNICTPGRPRQTSPTTYSEIIILDSPPAGHWPLKRSASLESRDNPFLPGGDLEKEADDILKRATIVRDRFLLDDGRRREQELASESVTLNESSPLNTGNDTTVVEDSISPQTAASTNTAPDGKPRQNGKLEDSNVSPASGKPEVGLDQPDGVTVTDDSTKDKKKQKKCCSVM